ncbi:DEAD/DEAH box helicase [Sphingobacterium spiritivorum]|uniref:DEAD/DEAH box helicase n=1 Tax=Sphingobacterium spiritivorum TaxID=258 RepID=UPI003DA2D0B6
MSKQDPQLIDYHSDYHQYLITDIDMDRTDRYSYFQEIDSTTNIGIPIEVEHLSVNDARFRIGFSENEETVLLKYTKPVLSIYCSCSEKQGLCQHQQAVFATFIRQEDWLTFFSPMRYHKLLSKAALAYGIEQEHALEEYFELRYTNNTIEVSVLNNHLIPLDNIDLFNKETLNPSTHHTDAGRLIIVFRKHKFYKHLQVQLFESEITKNGKLKNPVKPVDTSERIWKCKDITESRFFTAIRLLEQNTQDASDPNLPKALEAIVHNPFQLEVFVHDASLSENILASSLNAVLLKQSSVQSKLRIRKKGSFLSVEGYLLVGREEIALSDVNIQFDYFVQVKHSLYFIHDKTVRSLIQIFKNRNNALWIHVSKFEYFKTQILDPLSDQVSISYPDIPRASKKQLDQHLYYTDTEAIIYLDESQEYVTLTPVMRYGDVEVPVRSKRQIFGIDESGKSYIVERQQDRETALSGLLIRQHPYFEEQLDESFLYFYLHRKHFLNEDWFLNVFEEWHSQDIRVIGFDTLKNNTISPFKANINIEVLSGINWFNVNVNVSFGRKKASAKNLEKAVRNKSKFVLLDDGTHGILPEEWLEKFKEYFQAGEWNDEEQLQIAKTNFNDIDRLFEASQLHESAKQEIEQLKNKAKNFKELNKVNISKHFNGELRNYQLEGLKWLNFLDDFNFGGCLADDMGLGKTIQIIAFTLSQRDKAVQNCNLLVLPKTLLFNWQHELEKFAPSISYLLLDGTDRIRNTTDFDQYELILISYHTLLTDINYLKKFRFNYVFLDESQQIKNPNSQRYKAACLLQSRNRIVMTGTPIENSTMDLYAQLSFASPGLLGSKKYFKDVFTTPIDAFSDRKRTEMLYNKINPFILRRTKAEVARELPEKNELVIYCEMKPAQRRIYDLYEKEFREFISATEGDEIRKSPMYVLKGLTKLRQICNSTKLLKTEDLSTEDNSAKIETLIEQIEDNIAYHKIIVFSQFVSMLHLIQKALSAKGIDASMLTGKTKNREQVVHNFQEQEDNRVFLISLKAGGTGLNLTAASLVYLVDPWWNPAVENQAIDRAYRIGQQQTVTAVRLITPDTVEEKMIKMQQSKNELASALIGKEGNPLLQNFTKEQLLSLLR